MMLLLVVSGFVYWALTTTAGARLALTAGLQPLGGQVADVRGSIWQGLAVGHLSLPLDAAVIDASDLRLQVNWEALLTATVQVQELSVASLDIDVLEPDDPDPPESSPFEMPGLPVEVQVDRVALGALHVAQNGEPLPFDVTDLAASLGLNDEGAQLHVASLQVADEQSQLRLDGAVKLRELAEPWPLQADFRLSAEALHPDSPLCVDQYLDTLPGIAAASDDAAIDEAPDGTEKDEVPSNEQGKMGHGAYVMAEAIMAAPGLCHTHADLSAQGSMESLQLLLKAQGQDIALDSQVHLALQQAFPFREGELSLDLADGSGLYASVGWTPGEHNQADRIRGSVSANRLNAGQLAGGLLPAAVLQAVADFDVSLKNGSEPESVQLHLAIDEGSTWQEQALEGELQLKIDSPRHHGSDRLALDDAPFKSPVNWSDLHVHQLDIDLHVGNSHVFAEGGFGAREDALALKVDAPRLSAFWPDLPGGITLDALLTGGIDDHGLELDTRYTPPNSQPDMLGQAPIAVGLNLSGSWHQQASARVGAWLAGIDRLQIGHAGLQVDLSGSVPVLLAPMATGEQPLWSVGAGGLALSFHDKTLLEVQHGASSGSASGQFKTTGEIAEISLNQRLIRDLRPLLDQLGARRDNGRRPWRGRVKVEGEGRRATSDLALAAQWDLTFYRTLSGHFDLQRLSGDVVVPGVERIPLGLQELSLQVQASPSNQDSANVRADLTVTTARMGAVTARLAAPLRRFAEGGFGLYPDDTLSADIQADIDDLAWVSLFTGDELDFGGQVTADAVVQARLDGSWSGQGTIAGSELKIVRVDDGMRLLDGTLTARLDDSALIIDELSFPASLRVIPKEARTAEWITTQPEAQDGWLKVTGQWDLADMIGQVNVGLHRFPVLQRADRFAMLSGDINVEAALPALSITGKVEADAGWFDLDMLGGVATVDSDVVVIRGNEDPDEEVDVPMDISMDIEADLGPRFYLTGFGVNSGLVGSLRIIMIDNKLTGMGALRTRGGAVEAYGQRLQLRRGTVTFQGDITNPVLNIEALRTGLAVEAGVRVAGTGKKPRIDLVSYPDVSEVEKLSWLLFGHGPDESEGDMALLVSVGTAFLGGGEPFYRKFGIDEISLRSGELGSVASVLPAESVVSGLNDGANDLEKQFIVATKALSRGFSVSVRQALSDTGTVGRISYRIMRGVTAELSVGTINGLAFIHRWFARD